MNRNIYHYSGPPDEIRCDPMPVFRQLFTPESLHDAEISNLAFKDAQADTPSEKLQQDGAAAEERLRAATRKAFGLEPYSFSDGKEKGWLEEEVDALLIHFTEWITALKKKQTTSPISPQPTQDSWQWHQHSDLPMSHTPLSSASNLTGTGSNIAS